MQGDLRAANDGAPALSQLGSIAPGSNYRRFHVYSTGSPHRMYSHFRVRHLSGRRRRFRPGKLSGGVALIRAQKAIEKIEVSNEDQAIGVKILVRAIEEPLRQIVANAGEDAASAAGLLLTTEVMVAESPKDEDHKHPMPDMGGMGDMGM